MVAQSNLSPKLCIRMFASRNDISAAHQGIPSFIVKESTWNLRKRLEIVRLFVSGHELNGAFVSQCVFQITGPQIFTPQDLEQLMLPWVRCVRGGLSLYYRVLELRKEE